ncbi:arsenate reductase family protein [Mesonia sp. K7]|uniref:arsenate reductase family protein n=1 Tax=Mesonia sp. K7 TaxID=2218606 RepID=UPI000DA7C4AD|nr:ArsC/Spx/MgsR family protein [Mesonia sp. K7]PZD79011.1 hypothetical protein DNG35_03115 [Mesonia sp. K7]
MKNKVYHLSTCDTCKRILNEVSLPENTTLQNIKEQPISEKELEELHQLAGSYESLFNKRAQLYKQRDLKNKNLSEKDYKDLILEHYTFLKRPVFVVKNQAFIGNSKKTVASLKENL